MNMPNWSGFFFGHGFFCGYNRDWFTIEKISCKRQQLFLVFPRLYFLCPSASGMNGIPRSALLLVTALAGVMIAEPVEQFVPNRVEQIDKHRLSKRNPDIVSYQIAAMEVVKF